MCGIWAYLHQGDGTLTSEDAWAKGGSTLSPRGPDKSSVRVYKNGIWVFTRLAINGLNEAGQQPFVSACDTMRWMCNGEIYNWKQLSKRISSYSKSGSDCEIIGDMWEYCQQDPVAFARSFDGVFAIILHDAETDSTIVARDPYGVRPLYWGTDSKGGYFFGSERKSIAPFVLNTYAFPPGEVWRISSSLEKTRYVYHTIPYQKIAFEFPLVTLKYALESAVQKRLMTERPIAACLSGGLDSSLICALLQQSLRSLGKPPLQTFSIGMKGSTDLVYARMVADHIGSNHTEIIKTADEMFEAIPHVIRDIESYDITTVRASVGNWLVGKYISENTDCKVVFNGDGSDEVFGSYLYFNKAPTDEAYELECEKLLRNIHAYDVLRSDRCMSSHGLEARTPFLDKHFVNVALAMDTSLRRPAPGSLCEKWALRTAFDNELLPESVLWRKKEAFSDGVSSTEKSWFMEIQERVNVADNWSENVNNWYPIPPTPEAYYYRSVFESFQYKIDDEFPYWMPNWSPETNDPSARTLKN